MKVQLWVVLAVLFILGRNSPEVLAVPATRKAITRDGNKTHETSHPTATGTSGATHTTGTHGTATSTHTSTAAISSNTSTSASKPSGKLNRTPIIAGVAGGGGGFVAILLALLYFCRRKKSRAAGGGLANQPTAYVPLGNQSSTLPPNDDFKGKITDNSGSSQYNTATIPSSPMAPTYPTVYPSPGFSQY